MVEILRISPLKYRSFSIAVSSLSVPMYASRSSAGNFRSKSPYPLSAFEGSSSFLNLSYPHVFFKLSFDYFDYSSQRIISRRRLTQTAISSLVIRLFARPSARSISVVLGMRISFPARTSVVSDAVLFQSVVMRPS